MFYARYTDPKTGTQSVIAPRAYDAATHEGHLTCMEPGCPAHVHHVAEHATHGNAGFRRAHFAQNRGAIHKDACPALTPDDPRNAKRFAIETALDQGIPILLNMNMETPMRPLASFNAKARGPNGNPYQDWIYTVAHISYAMHDMCECASVLARIVGYGGAEALDRVHIGHQGDIRKIRDVMIGVQDKAQSVALFDGLYGRVLNRPDRDKAQGFPRLLGFVPSYASATRQVGDNVLQGAPMAGGQAHIVHFKDGLLDTDIVNHGGASLLFAAPFVERGTPHIQWRVMGEDCAAPLPREVKSLFKTEPDPAPIPRGKRSKTDPRQMRLL